ncbi:MAG: type IX secretion system outer membrane channel protein PorV [Chitinophagales bacterium]
MKHQIRLYLLLFTTIQFNSALNAQITLGNGTADDYLNTVTTAVPFLRMGPDARAAGMGDAGIALSPDVNSIYWNASKLAFIENENPSGISVTYAPILKGLVENVFYTNINGYWKPGELQAIGGSVRFFSLGSIPVTGTGVINSDFHPIEFAIDLSYALQLSTDLSAGFTLKYLNSNIPSQVNSANGSASSIAGDISFYYKKQFNKGSDLGLGLNISNIGNKMIYTSTIVKDYLPTNMGIGAAYTININNSNKITITTDINKLLVPTPDSTDIDFDGIPDFRQENVFNGMLSSFSDAPNGFSEELHEVIISGGLEYWFDEQFAVRTGYFHENKTKGGRQFFTLGIGVHYKIFGLDFSYLAPTENNQNPLDNTMRLTVMLNL